MSKATIKPLTDLERFELVQIMYPDEITEDDAGWDAVEGLIYEKFNIDVEDFDNLVGRLVMCAPVIGSPLTGSQHHALGSVTLVEGRQMVVAAVKREAQSD